MNKRHMNKTICLFAALLIALSASVISGIAAEEADLKTITRVIADVASTDNDNIIASDGYDHGYAPNISVFQNSDNTYAVCINQDNGTMKIIETDGTQLLSEITVEKELVDYGAFTKGTDGTYYVLYGAVIDDKDGNKTSMRLVNYNKNGESIRSLDIAGNASGHFQGISKLECGNNALSANDNYITGCVGRLMFTADLDGLVHQASYSFAIDTKNFEQVSVINSGAIPYASHSFHQYILQDGTDFIYVDRADALPARSFHLTKMSGNKSWTKLAEGESYLFKGEYGYNDTFSQLGGIIKTSAGYLLVSSYQNTTDSTDFSAANLVTQLFNTSTLTSSKEKVLTNYTGIRAEGVVNPKAMLIAKDKIAVPYMVANQFAETKRMYVGFLNAYGNLTDNRAVETNATLPRFGQVMYNSGTNCIEWFSIDNGELIIYSIDLGSVYDPTAPTEPEESTSETQPIPEETTQPETEPPTQAPVDPPAKLSFWQRIVNFFMGIYNWFISLFM